MTSAKLFQVCFHRTLLIIGTMAVIVSGATSQQRMIPAVNDSMVFSGRVEYLACGAARFDWPATAIKTFFTGTSCSAVIDGHGESFIVIIDSSEYVLQTDSSLRHYRLAVDLPPGIHTLSIIKRSEASSKPVVFRGLLLDPDSRVFRPEPPSLRIQFVGGSSACGFGNEGAGVQCDSIRFRTNAHQAFGPITARKLGADYAVIASQRRGIVRSWASPFITSGNQLAFYDRTVRSYDTPTWDHQSWIPHVIVINLGINDFSSRPHPPEGVFRSNYTSFLRTLRFYYPAAHLICISSDREPLRTHLETIAREMRIEGDSLVHALCFGHIPFHERGCDWHPNVAGHERIAAVLTKKIENLKLPPDSSIQLAEHH